MKVFHQFRLDAVNHCLWHADKRVPLTPKAFDVLRYLVEHADRLVTHDEILEALWPETHTLGCVTEIGVSKLCIAL